MDANEKYLQAISDGIRRRLQEKLRTNPRAYGKITAEIVIQEGKITIADVGENAKIKL